MTSPFSRIMIGLDTSQTDVQLMRYVQQQCFIKSDNQLYLIHVVPTLVSPKFLVEATHREQPFPLDEKLTEQIGERASENLEKGTLQIDILEGNVTSRLLHWENVKQVELTFLGKKDLASGSGVNALRFIRKSKSSVWFVPEKASLKVEKVLIATDFSPASTTAIQKAINLCRAYPISPALTFLHVSHAPSDMVYRLDKTYTQFSEELRKNVEAYFPTYLEQFDLTGINYQTAVVENAQFDIAQHIVEFAGDQQADLIILGAQGHSALESFLLGSIAEKMVIRNENASLLIMR